MVNVASVFDVADTKKSIVAVGARVECGTYPKALAWDTTDSRSNAVSKNDSFATILR